VKIGTSTDVRGNNVGNVLNDLVAANPGGLRLGVHGGDAAPSEEGVKGLVVARILVCTLVVTISRLHQGSLASLRFASLTS